MAILTTITCEQCGNKSKEAHSAAACAPRICSKCRKEEKDNTRTIYLQNRKLLSIENRLELIEAELYDIATAPPKHNMWTPIG